MNERRKERERERLRERERERERETDTWFIVKATDPYTKRGGGGKYVKINIHSVNSS